MRSETKLNSTARPTLVLDVSSNKFRCDENCVYHDPGKTWGVLEIHTRVSHDGELLRSELLINSKPVILITKSILLNEAVARLSNCNRGVVTLTPTSEVVFENTGAAITTRSSPGATIRQAGPVGRRLNGVAEAAGRTAKRPGPMEIKSGQKTQHRTTIRASTRARKLKSLHSAMLQPRVVFQICLQIA